MIEQTSAGLLLSTRARDGWTELADHVGLMLSRGFAPHVVSAHAGHVAVMMTAPA